MSLQSKTKIVVLNPFPIYPPLSGGQGRVFYLYIQIAQSFEVVVICFADRRSYQTIAPGLQQILIPKSPAHCLLERELFHKTGFLSCAIIPEAANLTPEYAHTVKRQVQDAGIVILSHPYLYQEAQKAGRSCPLVYDAHNVEIELQRQILPFDRGDLLAAVKQAEQAACEHSCLIAACSQADADTLASLYTISSDKFCIVPNGADIEAIPFVSYHQRQLAKVAGMDTQPCAIYIGSHFPPNTEAALQVIGIAKQLPNVRFLLVGSVCTAFSGQVLPENVDLCGVITEQKKHRLFSRADVALNPVLRGSGTNLKLLEYMAAGIPIITTPIGARGINQTSSAPFLIRTCDNMPAGILTLLRDKQLAADLVDQASRLVRAQFDWRQIAARYADSLSGVALSLL